MTIMTDLSQREEGKLQCQVIGAEEVRALEELPATQMMQAGAELVQEKAPPVPPELSQTVVVCH